jgi:hypothetical protein
MTDLCSLLSMRIIVNWLFLSYVSLDVFLFFLIGCFFLYISRVHDCVPLHSFIRLDYFKIIIVIVAAFPFASQE